MFKLPIRAGRSVTDPRACRTRSAPTGKTVAPVPPGPGEPWLQIDNMVVAPGERILTGCAAILAAIVPGGWFVWHGSLFTRIWFPLLCLAVGWRLAAGLLARSDAAAQPALLVSADGQCIVQGADSPRMPAVFEFGWRNEWQARIRCRVGESRIYEWRIYRDSLDLKAWNRLCRWLQWQSRGRRTPVQA